MICSCGCGLETKNQKRFIHGHNMRLIRKPNRFRVDKNSGCWIWLLCKNRLGYGQVGIQGKRKLKLAHVAMYEKSFGPVPKGKELDHLCKNPSCVNPQHLDPVSHKENVRRGRNVKLNLDKVKEIRLLAKNGISCRALSKKFNVHESHVSRIIHNLYWK